MKTAIAAAALGLGLTATPVLAQSYGIERGAGYGEANTLHLFGARTGPEVYTGSVLDVPARAVDTLTTGSIAPRGTDLQGGVETRRDVGPAY